MDAQLRGCITVQKKEYKTSDIDIRTTTKIIIVGHPDSGYQHVESTLITNGMRPAQPSMRDGLSAQLVTTQICSAHGVNIDADSLNITDWQEIKQLDVSPVWYALVLDLLRGNLNHSLWGWADPMAIHLLDFWKEVFPDATFVLVYNHPQTAITHGANAEAASVKVNDNAPSPEQSIQGWLAYNAALLHFYHRNQNRCLLVHADCTDNRNGDISSLANGTLSRLKFSDKTNREPLDALKRKEVDDNLNCDTKATTTSTNGQKAKKNTFEPTSLFRFSKEISLIQNEGYGTTDNLLEQYLANAILKHFPDASDMYEELQAIASTESTEKNVAEIGANVAWHALQDILAANNKLIHEKSTIQHQFGSLRNEFQHAQEQLKHLQSIDELAGKQSKQLEKAEFQLKKLQQQIEQKEIQLSFEKREKERTEQELSQENHLVIKQLFTVQEALEKTIFEFRSLEKQLQESRAILSNRETELAKYKKESLQSQQDILQLSKREKELAEKYKNELTLAQQEILERDREIHLLRANQKPVFLGAKQRQQNELIYQIGYTIVQLGQSFFKWKLLFYPLFIRKFLKQYICETDQTAMWLPPLCEYQDYEEAVKAQTHLSYQLGLTWQKYHLRFASYYLTPWALLGAYRKWNKAKQPQITQR
ncbi:MAG: hypothetical protein JXX14_02590 [Deltaproteobacteria bacterium]|nr:hypothetical protein [Deltaproteobacteria bacterium]